MSVADSAKVPVPMLPLNCGNNVASAVHPPAVSPSQDAQYCGRGQLWSPGGTSSTQATHRGS